MGMGPFWVFHLFHWSFHLSLCHCLDCLLSYICIIYSAYDRICGVFSFFIDSGIYLNYMCPYPPIPNAPEFIFQSDHLVLFSSEFSSFNSQICFCLFSYFLPLWNFSLFLFSLPSVVNDIFHFSYLGVYL